MTSLLTSPRGDRRPVPTPDPFDLPDLRDRYCAIRSHTDELTGVLSPEDQCIQSMPDVSPTKWHRAHTTWFFETFVLTPNIDDYAPHDPTFGYLFNSYYEQVGPRHPRPDRGLLSRPSSDEVAGYRRAVDDAMTTLLTDVDPASALGELVTLGLHHEQQHQELILMDIKHVLSRNPTEPAYVPAGRPAEPCDAPAGWLEHPGGVVSIGHLGSGFSFDNEGPVHEQMLQPFAVADRLVTNRDWLAFMEAGGYDEASLWLSDGWYAVQAQGWTAPLYWTHRDDGWVVHTLHGTVPVDPASPVCHVSHYEADAFARWAGSRLPTEAEWEVVAAQSSFEPQFAIDHLQPRAASMDDPEQWFGAVWQHTASPYSAYPGFVPAPGAVGEYNGKFMINQMTLRGSASVTSPGHARPTYRNFFPPGARWMFAGVRLAQHR